MTEITSAVTQPEGRDTESCRERERERQLPWSRSSVQLEFPDGFRQGLA